MRKGSGTAFLGDNKQGSGKEKEETQGCQGRSGKKAGIYSPEKKPAPLGEGHLSGYEDEVVIIS